MLEAAAREAAHRGAEQDAEKIREDARVEAAEIIRVAREAATLRIDRLGRSRQTRIPRLALLAAVVAAAAALGAAGGWALWSAQRSAAVPTPDRVSQGIADASSCPIPARYRGAFVAASHREGVPLSLLTAVASVESRWQLGAVSTRGAVGLMQLLPATARYLGVNPYNWRQNVVGGARFLRLMLAQNHGNTELAVASYDAGPYRVAQGSVPLETVVYVGAVMAQQAQITGCH